MYANGSFMSASKKTSRGQDSMMSSISGSSDSSMSVRSGSTVQSPNTYSFDPPNTPLQRQNSIPLDHAPPPPLPTRTPELYRNQQDLHRLVPIRHELSVDYEHHRQDPRSRKSGPSILRRRNLILLSIVSLALSILSSMLIAFLYFNKELSQGDVKASSIQETCLECAALNFTSADAELFQKLLKKQKDGTALCCARTSGQMSALIQLMIASNSNITLSANPNTKQFIFSPVSAHVSFQGPEVPVANIFEKSNLNLSNPDNCLEQNCRHHIRNVTFKTDRLSIVHPGWYFVYSSVFMRTVTSCSNLKEKIWGNYIMRHKRNRPDRSGCLVKTAHTCCSNCASDYHTSYTAGVFNLIEGDEIFIEVTASGLVGYKKESSFMGLVMLGSDKNALMGLKQP